jgi:AsmA protein
MKKFLKIAAGIVALILVALIAIPFFVDVDQFRPKIVEVANQHLNGKFELGKLKLSLWGRVRVSIDGLNLKDSGGQSVVSVKDAGFDIPFMSVLSGAPLVTLSMKEPKILVIKNKSGKLNVMSLMKDQPAKEAGTTSAEAGKGTSEVQLPAMAVNARLGVSIVDAKVDYRDDSMGLTNTIDRLNLRVKDLSLSRATELELWADLKTQMGKAGQGTRVEGPLKLIANLKPEVVGGSFKSAALDAIFTADDLEIQQGDLFYKSKGIPFNFKFNGALSEDSLNLKQAALRFHNAEVTVSGQFQKATGANFLFESKPVDLKPWSALVPMLKEYELEGKLGVNGKIYGQPEAMQYQAKLTVDALSMKGPMLKSKPVLNGEVSIITDKIDRFLLTLTAPGNEMVLDGKVTSFTAPQVVFSLKSKGMDLDQWVDFPKPSSKSDSKAAGGGGDAANGTAGDSAGATDDYDAMLEPLRSNAIAKATTIDGSVSLAFIKAMNVRIDDISLKILMKNLVASISGLKMKMYDGNVSGSFTTDLKPKQPQYTMQLAVSGFDMQKAVESQFASFKNTLIGKLNATISGGGSSFNTLEVKKRLQLKGEFKMADASFKSIDVAKMANEAVNKSVAKIAEKVPALAGKSVKVPANGESKYELVSSQFTMSGGYLEAPNFVAKAAPKRGIDIKGYTKMGLIDESLDAKWELIDLQRMTGADQLSANIAGKNISNILAKGEQDPVILPISVGCKWSAPCTSYTQVPEYLAGVAAGRIAKAAGDVAKSKAQEAVQKAIGDQAPAVIKKGLKGLFGN